MRPPLTLLAADFAARFGDEQMERLYGAALSHRNGVHDKTGADPFRWAVLICVGFECVSKYSEWHGLTFSEEDFRAWAKEHSADFAQHRGDVDYLTLFVGGYDWLVGGGDDGVAGLGVP